MSPAPSSFLSPSLLAWLRCFDAAARCGSFTRAAEELHVSQGAVSQQVKKLEERLNVALFLRVPSGLTLTPAGEQLVSATRDSFRGLELALSRLHASSTGEPVNISCSPSLAMLWLTLRLGSLYRAHPYLALRVVGESDGIDLKRMAREGVAAAIRFGPGDDKHADGVDLLDEWLVPVASPAFIEAHPELRTEQDLRGAHLLHAADPFEVPALTDEWTQWLRAAHVDLPAEQLRQGTQFNLSLLAVQAALGSQGVAMGRLALVQGYLLQGRLVAPFRKRVRARAAYWFVGSSSHPELSTIQRWLLDETRQFKERRDAYFDQEGFTAV
ncbi:LysR family transcriptional regulator [Variovorax sp. KK3]|uniref:LysR family transcriptional regulator n=1 Tax=Variovorax sp. KK3 TaxID=1855728 RepID=UPI00097BDE48|nr:LysR family transcriptional regulator [Variovorax sp. KK3]